MDKREILSKIKGGLIVSCQALEDEPLHSSFIMSRMAYSAKLGGAVGIRANSVEDIEAIRKTVDLPIIGIIKKIYDSSDVYISPTIDEIDALVKVGTDIIATDATARVRPGGSSLEEFYAKVRKKYPSIVLMADTSTYEEGVKAKDLGFDLVGTTLCGYTEYTKGTELPNFNLLERLVKDLNMPIVAEGGIWSPEQLKKVMELNAFTAVVGTAITRPREITRRFVNSVKSIGGIKK